MFRLNYIIIFLVITYLALQLFIKCNAESKGDIAPDFETQLVDGTDFRLSDLKGNYVLLDFWASWCGPCMKDHPKIVGLHDRYGDKTGANGERFIVVTVGLEKNQKRWRQVAQQFGFSWKNQIVEEAQFVMLSPLALKYGVSEIPAKFLINPEGKLSKIESLDALDLTLAAKFN